MQNKDEDIGRLIAEISYMRRELDELKNKAAYRTEQESFNELTEYRISTVEARYDSIKAKAKPLDIFFKYAKLVGIGLGILIGFITGAGIWQTVKAWLES